MRPRVDFKNTAGKTIEKVTVTVGQLLVTFTDGTYVYAGAEQEYDGVELNECHHPDDLMETPYALNMGIITQEEYDNYHARKKARYDDWDRQQYEWLRAKFEGGPAGEARQ